MCEKCLQVGDHLNDPVRLGKDDSGDVEDTSPSRQEWLVLHPSNDVVKTPGEVEEDGRDGEVPIVDGRISEDEGTMERATYKLRGGQRKN